MSKDRANQGDKVGLLNRRSAMALAGSSALLPLLGIGTATANETLPHTLLIDASDGRTCSYSIGVSGTANLIPTLSNSGDNLSEGVVTGNIRDGYSGIRYSGEITQLTIDGTANILFGEDAEQEFPKQTSKLVITSPTEIDYEFTTSDKVSKVLDGSKLGAEENNDTTTINSDGSYTVTGHTGNGYGDTYRFRGSVDSFTPADGDFTITVDGEEISVYELTGQDPPSTKRLTITSPSEVSYEFAVSGTATRVREGSDIDAETGNDAITKKEDEMIVTGYTGNGYGDSYDITGDITDFSPLKGDFTLTVNGKEVEPYELTGEEPPEARSTAVIGGGEGYQNIVPPSEATFRVNSLTELRQALDSAEDGDIVYVNGSADIDTGSAELIVSSGVTLASNRGINGAPGGRLRTDDRPWGMLRAQDDARITGLRIGGPRWDWVSYGKTEMGVDAQGSGVEIDNIEAYGWGYASVRAPADTHVHHSYLHHNSMEGLGYGVAVSPDGQPLIEYNMFEHNRHSVESDGGGYTARYNYVKGPSISHVFDQHRPGGDTIKIYNNTIEVVENAQKNKKAPGVAIRGVPDNIAEIHNNWFYNPEEPRETPDGWTDEAIIQVHTNSWQNVKFSNNHYGADEPSSDIGHPR